MLTAVERFLVFMAASLVVYFAIVRWVLRKRSTAPSNWTVAGVSCVVVIAGMLFARYAARLGVAPALYYGLPAVVTLTLPVVVFRMNRSELASYVILAFASSPAIHLLFSLFLDWHEYLPFWYVPSIREITAI